MFKFMYDMFPIFMNVSTITFGSSNAVRSSDAIPDKNPSTKPNNAAPIAWTLSALSISFVCDKALSASTFAVAVVPFVTHSHSFAPASSQIHSPLQGCF